MRLPKKLLHGLSVPQMAEAEVAKLEPVLRAANVPLILVRSYGLFGSLRISATEHRVIESKPDSEHPDLRCAAFTVLKTILSVAVV